MRVSLISKTEIASGEFTKGIGPAITADGLVAYCARVSNPNNQGNDATAPKLIRYLVDHHHWSPFEMISMCVEIETSRAISQQIVRHRSFSYQEFSQRYAHVPSIEVVELRLQSKANRQGGEDSLSQDAEAKFQSMIDDHFERTVALYDTLIDAGVAKECARMVMPMSSTTRLYMNGTVRSWIHYLEIRTDPHTQKEHRDIALAIKAIFCGTFPVIAEALGWR